MNENLEALQDALPGLLDGVTVTLQLTLGGAVLALVVSVVLGLLSISPVPPLRWGSTIVVEVFRGTSLVVQLFWFYYVMPLFGLSWDAVLTGVVALGLNYGAYGAEVVRGSINAVDKGQWEGATALNMSPLTRMRRVIWPQAWVLMLSGYNNLLVMLVKGTAVALFIGLQDLTNKIDQLRIQTDTIFAFSIGLVAYFVIAWVLSQGLRLMENHARRRLGMATGGAHSGTGETI